MYGVLQQMLVSTSVIMSKKVSWRLVESSGSRSLSCRTDLAILCGRSRFELRASVLRSSA